MAESSSPNSDLKASSGHKLGQLIGNWFEQYFVLPLLGQVTNELDLFLDHRFRQRAARSGKIIWVDVDGNEVDYDFVLELNGTETKMGIPVGFIESFWRRGSRHSKDKARDDSGKLMPMRETYPTARFLGIVSAGDFTRPARELVINREIDLFYIPKDKIVKAFEANGLIMDYPDSTDEDSKWQIASKFEAYFSMQKKEEVVTSLIELMGKATVSSYTDRVRSKLSALPQEIRFILQQVSKPIIFESLVEATRFLQTPIFTMVDPQKIYLYQITYSDGSEFERTVMSIDELRDLHGQITALAEHMNRLREGD